MLQIAGLWFPDGETHLPPEIAKSPQVDGKGTYQLHKLELALSHVKQFRTAIDVGAHCGTWSRILAKHFQRVEAFEPKAEHCECFTLNVTASNVTLHQCALGAEADSIRMSTLAAHSSHTFVVPHGGFNGPLQTREFNFTVPEDGDFDASMKTLDSLDLQDVDFIKIDVEGYERQVLAGAVETLERCRPTIIVEQKPFNGRRYDGDDHSALKFLEGLGARIVAQKAGDYVFVW